LEYWWGNRSNEVVRCPIWAIFGLSTIFWFYLLFPHQQPLNPVKASFHETRQHEALFGFALIIVSISVWLFIRFLIAVGSVSEIDR
jgi:hypothetical protein